MFWPDRTSGRLSFSFEHISDQRLAINGSVQSASNRDRSKRGSLRIERNEELITSWKRYDLDIVVSNELDGIRRDVGHHVNVAAKKPGPGRSESVGWTNVHSFDARRSQVVVVESFKSHAIRVVAGESKSATTYIVGADADWNIQFFRQEGRGAR